MPQSQNQSVPRRGLKVRTDWAAAINVPWTTSATSGDPGPSTRATDHQTRSAYASWKVRQASVFPWRRPRARSRSRSSIIGVAPRPGLGVRSSVATVRPPNRPRSYSYLRAEGKWCREKSLVGRFFLLNAFLQCFSQAAGQVVRGIGQNLTNDLAGQVYRHALQDPGRAHRLNLSLAKELYLLDIERSRVNRFGRSANDVGEQQFCGGQVAVAGTLDYLAGRRCQD